MADSYVIDPYRDPSYYYALMGDAFPATNPWGSWGMPQIGTEGSVDPNRAHNNALPGTYYIDTPREIGGQMVSHPAYAQQLGQRLYAESQANQNTGRGAWEMGGPGYNAAFLAAALAGGGAFANGGAGYGAGLSEITLPSSVAPISSPVGLGAGPPGAAFGPVTNSGILLPGGATVASSGLGAANAAASTGSAVVSGADTAARAANAADTVASGLNWADIVPSIISGLTGVLGADAQGDAAKDAVALSERMFNTAREDALPRIQAGNRAVGLLDQYLGLTTGTPDQSRFTASPSYQYNLTESTRAGERALGSMGLRNSGAQVREAQRNASGLASREDGKFVDQLLAAAGLGTTGAAASAAAGANHASIGGNALQNQGAARSSGYGAVNDAVQGGIANHMLRQYLNRYPVYG